jgi:hypothetical protein
MAKFVVTAITGDLITLKTPHTNYETTLRLASTSTPPTVGQIVRGNVHAPAWKIDVVSDGGNYIEPLLGRPRRMQGEIRAVLAASNSLTVHVGFDVTVQLPERYNAATFAVGSRVGWDNIDIPELEITKQSPTGMHELNEISGAT